MSTIDAAALIGGSRLVAIAERTGDYKVQVRSTRESDPRGRYELRVLDWREAGPKDQEIVSGETAYKEAARLELEGNARQAFDKYQEALDDFRNAGDLERQAELLQITSARCNADFGAYLGLSPDCVLERQLEALAIWRKLGNRTLEAACLSWIASSYKQFGYFQDALDSANQSLAIVQELGNLQDQFLPLQTLGAIYADLGDPETALRLFLKSRESLPEDAPPKLIALILDNIANAYAALGDQENSLKYKRLVVDLWHGMGNRGPMEALALNALAEARIEWGLHGQALEHLDRALELYRSRNLLGGEIRTLNNRGRVYLALRDPTSAREAFSSALERRKGWGGGPGAMELDADLATGMGEALFSLGDRQGALDSFRQALGVSRKWYDWKREAADLRRIAEIESTVGNWDDARRNLESALEIIESARSRISGPTFRGSYSASKRAFYDSYIDLLMRHGSPDNAGLALEACERARMRSLVEMLMEARIDIREGVDPALLEQERRLAWQINTKQQNLVSTLADQDKARLARETEKDLEGLLLKYEQTQAEIRAKNPRYAALVHPRAISLSEIQSLLDPQTLLLEYWLGEKAGYVWAVSRDSVAAHVLPERARVEEEARLLYDLLANRQAIVPGEKRAERSERLRLAEARYRETAASLSRMLLGPVKSELGTRRLLIVPDGALQYLPFSALPAPEAETGSEGTEAPARFCPSATGDCLLIHDHEVVNLPSVSVLVALRGRETERAARPKTVAVFADPVFDKDDPRVRPKGAKTGSPHITTANRAEKKALPQPGPLKRAMRDAGFGAGFPRLMASRQEAHDILAADPSGRSMESLDFDASRTRVLSGELRGYSIIHFATHGLVNNSHPELSGLVFSLLNPDGTPQDGFLRLHEIYNLECPADLVVLSACNTALGKPLGAEGLVGLTRGFMYAGARRVLATLWKVDDEASAEEMTRLYRNLFAHGMSPAAALRAAQLEMLQTRRWKAPYYWAAFVLQGD